MSGLLRFYLKCTIKHPWKTQSITTGVIMASGDFICQKAIEKKPLESVDPSRVARFALIGSCYVAPLLKGWYSVLERVYGATGRTVGLKKMLSDQAIYAPTFLVGFLSVNALLRGETLNQIKQILQRDYFDVLKVNYMIWPGAQLITFYLIPFQHRVLFVNCIALMFNTYLSWKTNSQQRQPSIGSD